MTAEHAELSAELAVDADAGTFSAVFSRDDVVTDYGQIIAPDAFTQGAKVPFIVGHQRAAEWALGVGKVVRGEGEWRVDGRFLDTEYAQSQREQLVQMMELGVVPDVSISMDWRTWKTEGREAMSGGHKRRKNKMGEQANTLITKVPRLNHLALVAGGMGAMPDAKMVSALSRDDEQGTDAAMFESWRGRVLLKCAMALAGGSR